MAGTPQGNLLQGALQAGLRSPASHAGARHGDGFALIGAAGALGSELLSEALARRGTAQVEVATRAPLRFSLQGMAELRMPGAGGSVLPPVHAGTALICLDRGRIRRQRDEVFHDPQPEDLLPLARCLRERGVHTLVVLHPQSSALLPQALRRGLASMQEHEVAGLGFDRMLFVRPAQGALAPRTGALRRFVSWWWSQLALMLPASDRPVRAATVAAFVFEVLERWPRDRPGTRVAGPLELSQSAQPQACAQVVERWLAL